jgi:hypothetical protein
MESSRFLILTAIPEPDIIVAIFEKLDGNKIHGEAVFAIRPPRRSVSIGQCSKATSLGSLP